MAIIIRRFMARAPENRKDAPSIFEAAAPPTCDAPVAGFLKRRLSQTLGRLPKVARETAVGAVAAIAQTLALMSAEPCDGPST